MEEEENILDSGEIYKYPEEERKQLELLEPKVEWTKVKPGTRAMPGGNKWKTHVLTPISKDTIFFLPTLLFGVRNLFWLFSGPALIGLSVFTFYYFQNPAYLMISVFSLIMFAMGYYAFKGISPKVFNKKKEIYSSGLFKKTKVNLTDIKAIQLIQEYVPGSQEPGESYSAYYSYEINLVLNSGDRLNVIDHGAKSAALQQANRLANFLNVPLLMLKEDFNVK